MLRLQLMYDDRVYALDLADGEHAVGRASDNAVRIPSPRVSKYHAILRTNGERRTALAKGFGKHERD